ncbi:MAG: aminotransferase class IV [Actinobacteria bacterium]|nr:aminotransferase class IV [Actinomycetota bacterium]
MSEAPRTRPGPRAIAWADGRVLPASEATVPLTDDGFLRGDAVFDAMLVRRGRTHALDDHLARLRASAKTMGIRVPVLRQVIVDLLAAWGEHDGALKLVVTRGGVVRGLVSPVSWPDSIALETVEMPWASALAGVKTLSYAANQWALRQARDAHADDALIVDGGVLMELPTGALCLVLDGRVVTPDPGRLPILDSVTVRQLGAVTDIERGTPTVADLDTADEVFVVSATRPVLPVHAVGDREYPAPGPVTEDLRSRFDDHIDATLDPLP